VRGHQQWGEPDAPAAVFWPGLGSTGLTPVELAPALVAGGRRVIGLEPPLSASDDFGLASLAARVCAAAPAPFVAMGHSWGASVAAVAAVRDPGAVAALVLLDGSFMRLDEYAGGTLDERLAVLEAHIRTMRWASRDAYVADERRRVGRWSPELDEARRATVHAVDGAIVPRMSAETALAALRALDAYDPPAVLPALAAARFPILLLVAAEPAGRREEVGAFVDRFAAAVPRADVRWLPAGHDLVSELGPELGRIVADWLAEVT